MKQSISLAAGLFSLCLLAATTVADHPSGRLASAPAVEASLTPVTPVVIELRDLPPATAGAARPDREGERSRIESAFSEKEIELLIAEALALPADPDVQQLGASEGGLGFSLGTSFDSMEVTECCISGTLNPPDSELKMTQSSIPSPLVSM